MQIINRHFLSGIIHFVREENFPKNLHFWNPDTHTYTCVSGGSNVSFSRSVAYLLNEWYLTRFFLEQNFTLHEKKNLYLGTFYAVSLYNNCGPFDIKWRIVDNSWHYPFTR